MSELGFPLGFAFGLAAAAVLFAIRCMYRIDEGHVGVLTTFGKAEFEGPDGESKHLVRTQAAGLHFKYPWQKVHSVSMMEQIIDLSGEQGGIQAMASDGTILRLDSKLRYAPVHQELYDFLFALREPVAHIKGLFTCLLRNEIANFKPETPTAPASAPGSYSMIRSERKLLNSHIEGFTRGKIGGHYGVRFDAVDLTDILPPDELAHALNAVFNAQSEADTSYARAEGECQSRVLSARKGVLIAAERAKAAEIEVKTLGRFLKELKTRRTLKQYVERRRAETTYESRAVFVRRPS